MFKNLDDYISSPVPIRNELKQLFVQERPITVFDIGACEFEDSIRYSLLFPRSTVYAFEPLRVNFENGLSLLKKYGCKNVHPFNIALSNQDGSADFYVSSGSPRQEETEWNFGNKSNSLLPPGQILQVHSWQKFKEKIIVTTKRLESFCNENKISAIDFIHMDVQGAELLVLEGAGNIIRNIKSIWLEVEKVPLYQGQALENDIDVFLVNNGFSTVKDTTGEIAGDKFYVNTKFFPKQVILKMQLMMRIKKLYNKFKKSRSRMVKRNEH